MLLNRRILITRPRSAVSALEEQLRSQGAVTIAIPTIELVPPDSSVALDRALRALSAFDMVVFTSPSAVQAFVARVTQLGVLPHLHRVAVVGPSTAAAVRAAGLQPAEPTFLMPAIYTAEALAEHLAPHIRAARILLPQSALAAGTLACSLVAAGAQVTAVTAYNNIVPADSMQQLAELFATAPPDAITFTSASTAQNLAALLSAAGLAIPDKTVLASIGPITSQAMRALALEPDVEARAATIPALVEALAQHFNQPGS